MLINVNLKEWSLIETKVIEEAFAAEHWLYTGWPESPMEGIYLFQ